jgi:hypothetical protein
MKRFNLLGLCALAACAMALVALPVSSASAAAKKVLQLNEGSTKAPNEDSAIVEVDVDSCVVRASGHLTTNDAATIKLAAAETSFGCIEGETSGTGSITEASLTATKKLTLKGSIDVSEEVEGGKCTYAFTKFSGTFAVPGSVTSKLKLSGKLVKGSAKGCAKTDVETVTAIVAHPIGETFEIFKSELVS